MAAVAALFPTDEILLVVLFDRGDSLDKLVCVDDVFDVLETGACNDVAPPYGNDLNVDKSKTLNECSMFVSIENGNVSD